VVDPPARTRAALIVVSQRRFAEDGYHETTLEGI
jgi:AcrR family transcriptional regulator